jgi:hypothetical protein
MSGANTRSTRKMSASSVEDEMASRAATGPVISVASRIVSVRKVTPSASASNVTVAGPVAAVVVSFWASLARWNLVHCVPGIGQSSSWRMTNFSPG